MDSRTKSFVAVAMVFVLVVGIFVGILTERDLRTTPLPTPPVTENANPEPPVVELPPEDETSAWDKRAADFDYSRIFMPDGKLKDIDVSSYITLPDYSTIDGDPKTLVALDEMLKQEIAYLLLNFEKEEHITDRAVELYDMVEIAYTGRVDGIRFEGGSAESATVLAGGSDYVDDFLQQIIGHMPGETFDVTVTFPEDYTEQELAGREAVFETTINSIYSAENFTDDFVLEFLEADYGFTTAQGVIDYLSENFLATHKQNLVSQFFENLITTHLENLEVPQELYDYFADSYLRYYSDVASMSGMDLLYALQTYADAASVEEAVMSQHDAFMYDVVFVMAVQTIAEAEGITVDTEDMEATFVDMGWSLEEYLEGAEMYGMPYFANYLLMDKVGELLVQRVVFR